MFLAFVLTTSVVFGQISENDPLFQTMKEKDSLLFDRAFNHCETQWLEVLVSEDFEFYHDQGGITPGKKDFIEVMRTGICGPENPYRSRRELLAGSMEVFPLYNQGILYGALQRGKHRFYETDPTGDEKLGSTALFTHLWLLMEGEWKLARVLSFHHHNP